MAMVTPTASTRPVKRAGSVTIGIARQDSVAAVTPPVSATLAAMITSEAHQAPKIAYSGCDTLTARRSASTNKAPAMTSGAIVHNPIHGADSSSAAPTTANA